MAKKLLNKYNRRDGCMHRSLFASRSRCVAPRCFLAAAKMRCVSVLHSYSLRTPQSARILDCFSSLAGRTFSQNNTRYSTPLVISKRTMTTTVPTLPRKVAVIGAGSFGSAMVKVLSQAALQNTPPDDACPATTVSWYARRQSIVDEINIQHTNRQYFEGGVFDGTVVSATASVRECVKDAAVVVLSVPSLYLPPLLSQFQQEHLLQKDAVLVSVIKSLHYENGRITTAVDHIQSVLPDYATVALSGPNLYKEMTSDESFAEATIGYDADHHDAARLVQHVTSSRNFLACLAPNNRWNVELCGGLKNVLSLAVGYCEGMEFGWNVRAAVLRAGLHEMVRFMDRARQEQPETQQQVQVQSDSTKAVFETSAGMGDVILTCTAGRGRQLAAAFCQHGLKNGVLDSVQENRHRWEQLEHDLLHGMKLPDWHNAQYVHQALRDWKCESDFPLLMAVYKIGFEGEEPRYLIEALRESIQQADC